MRGRSRHALGGVGWELVVVLIAVVFSVVAFWATLRAGFLAHPGWLAVQKADLILGPIGVGLYWRHRRPDNRLGLLLIALGLVAIPYVAESSSSPGLFTFGVQVEYAIEGMTVAAILAFPNGRVGRAGWVILTVWFLGGTLADWLFVPVEGQATPYFSISGCRTLCPPDPLYSSSVFTSIASWLPAWVDVTRSAAAFTWLATAGLVVWRFVTGTPPRRRALAIGAPIAMFYLLASAAYQLIQLFNPQFASTNAEPLAAPLQWVVAASRASVWYGFLLALIAAELFAGRALRGLVGNSLGRPSLGELQRLVRAPLGDPGLRVGVWRTGTRDWVGADGAVLAPPGTAQVLTEFERDGEPATAIVHDRQLAEDPELLKAAGAVVLLAEENAELDAAWKRSLGELADSRGRLVSAGARERRKLERDLHDGAQQRLLALQVKLRMTQEHATPELADELAEMRVDAMEAVEELRALARGIYPPVLVERGVADALRSVAITAPVPVAVHDSGIGRCEVATEAALYFCVLEAIQNAIKYAGPEVEVTITFSRDEGAISFSAADNGTGMEPSTAAQGMGLTDMRDRIEAVGGEIEIASARGQGTVVRGTVPDKGPGLSSRRRRRRTLRAPADTLPSHGQAENARDSA
ncbi:MAG: sensor histidine kinase [Solirubrobacteraceae bacterium]